eukprot:TRINITY_DN536_c0_g1_i5.p1 TRINITY_DN536_c0_g1~~TRINITY_DN536_c0_g1_i5.p1  ORF type:complete len:369 (+),score=63.28 TRINITY_DN536_c0_g1_i5:134-1240(+)
MLHQRTLPQFIFCPLINPFVPPIKSKSATHLAIAVLSIRQSGSAPSNAIFFFFTNSFLPFKVIQAPSVTWPNASNLVALSSNPCGLSLSMPFTYQSLASSCARCNTVSTDLCIRHSLRHHLDADPLELPSIRSPRADRFFGDAFEMHGIYATMQVIKCVAYFAYVCGTVKHDGATDWARYEALFSRYVNSGAMAVHISALMHMAHMGRHLPTLLCALPVVLIVPAVITHMVPMAFAYAYLTTIPSSLIGLVLVTLRRHYAASLQPRTRDLCTWIYAAVFVFVATFNWQNAFNLALALYKHKPVPSADIYVEAIHTAFDARSWTCYRDHVSSSTDHLLAVMSMILLVCYCSSKVPFDAPCLFLILVIFM